ncbi:MAG TPA: hypothetical protein VHG08_11550 [Longimicrobium sp.]|nr:hypothetical protein [Longimicrobium sp.]
MESSSAVPAGTAGRLGRRLLLALALAACGGGDQASSGAPKAGDAALAAAAPGDTACPQPPAIDTTIFKGPYRGLTQWFRSNNVSFKDTSPDSTVALVRLCNNCAAVKLTILSEARTYCTRRDSLAGKTRIAGVYVVDSGSVAPAGWGRTFNPGDSIFLFARNDSGPAKLVYPVVRTPTDSVVGAAPDTAWAFRYCNDGHPGRAPQGKWRKYRPRNPAAGQTAATAGDERTYGWMACASGCCQFYVPPPDPTLPDQVPDFVSPGNGKPPCTPVRP